MRLLDPAPKLAAGIGHAQLPRIDHSYRPWVDFLEIEGDPSGGERIESKEELREILARYRDRLLAL